MILRLLFQKSSLGPPASSSYLLCVHSFCPVILDLMTVVSFRYPIQRNENSSFGNSSVFCSELGCTIYLFFPGCVIPVHHIFGDGVRDHGCAVRGRDGPDGRDGQDKTFYLKTVNLNTLEPLTGGSRPSRSLLLVSYCFCCVRERVCVCIGINYTPFTVKRGYCHSFSITYQDELTIHSRIQTPGSISSSSSDYSCLEQSTPTCPSPGDIPNRPNNGWNRLELQRLAHGHLGRPVQVHLAAVRHHVRRVPGMEPSRVE